MAHHLEVLGVMEGGGCGVVEGVAEAQPFDRRLGDAADRRWCLDAQRVEHGWHHVDDVGVVGPNLPARRDALRPGHDERIGRTAAVRLPLPPPKRRVAGMRPAPREVVEDGGAADLVDMREAVLHGVFHTMVSSTLWCLPHYGVFHTMVSSTLSENRSSLTDPAGPPSALEPLSEISMISVLSYSPRSLRN